MILPDVNVLLYAVNPAAVNHQAYRQWLDSVVNGDEAYGMSPEVLCSVTRILTNARAMPQPQPLNQVIAFANLLLDQPNCEIIRPGQRHWQIFCNISLKNNCTGNLVPDAWLAALAIESGCELITLDRDFRRFDGLRFRAPF